MIAAAVLYLLIGLLGTAAAWLWMRPDFGWRDAFKVLFYWPFYALFLLCVAYLWVVL